LAICHPSIFPGNLMSVMSTSATRRLQQASASSPSAGTRKGLLAQSVDSEFTDERIIFHDEYAPR
jgi:hypothetical protein